MKDNQYFIIDFDSTFVRVEALDEVAKIALKAHPEKERITKEIATITQKSMDGTISFPESLSQRLELFQANKSHIQKVISLLKKNITPSIQRNRDFFKKNWKHIYIISGGFREYILPVVKSFGIPEQNVFANDFLFEEDTVIGYDKKNLLAQKQGKVKQIKKLSLHGKIYLIGDGYTDYEIKKEGLVETFFAFTENVKRQSIIDKADHVVSSFDEILFLLDISGALSYPKNRMKVLLLENINHQAIKLFINEGYDVKTISKALSEKELQEKIRDVSILCIRSKTEITAQVLNAANKLHAIGAFCIGTNQIDLSACNKRGVIVFNAPFSNTRSVVELVIGEIIMLSRHVIDGSNNMHQGIWQKTSKNRYEIRGKKLGIIGYGNIGSQLSVLAENLGMEVYFYDIAERLAIGNAKKCDTLEELLEKSDFITVHVDGNKNNKNLIGDHQFQCMKKGVIFLNISRGFVVDIDALFKHMRNGKVLGAGIDVFPDEPKSNTTNFHTRLQKLPNIILTPHIGGSTEEAQKNIGEFVTNKLTHFMNTGNTTLSVNFPNIQLPELKDVHRLIHIHHNVPGILAKINQIFAKHQVNIEGQYLKTNEEIGYAITDVNKNYNQDILDKLKEIPETIKVRILY